MAGIVRVTVPMARPAARELTEMELEVMHVFWPSEQPLTVTEVDPLVTTDIHNAAHAIVTSVAVGTTVHDSATVSGPAGLPTPSGNVTIQWFTNNECTGDPADSSAATALVDGTAGLVWAPAGHRRGVARCTIRDGKIIAIDLVADPERMRQLDIVVVDA